MIANIPLQRSLGNHPVGLAGSLAPMFPIGGVAWMLLGTGASALVCLLLFAVLRPRVGVVSAAAIAGLCWSVVVIGLVTLLPANGAPGWVPAEGRLETCSTDLGGPAPDGFWIFSGGQRLLNTVIFMPSGALLVVALARWRSGWALMPLGFLALSGYAVGIEFTQLALARLDRACDVTDMVDNATGAALGMGIGLVLALLLRPWRASARVRS